MLKRRDGNVRYKNKWSEVEPRWAEVVCSRKVEILLHLSHSTPLWLSTRFNLFSALPLGWRSDWSGFSGVLSKRFVSRLFSASQQAAVDITWYHLFCSPISLGCNCFFKAWNGCHMERMAQVSKEFSVSTLLLWLLLHCRGRKYEVGGVWLKRTIKKE